MNCPICGGAGPFFGNKKNEVECSRCGKYCIDEETSKVLITGLKGNARKIANASGWVRDHQNELINLNTAKYILDLQTPSIPEKGLRLLKYLERKTSVLGQKLANSDDLISVAAAINNDELKYIFEYIRVNGYVEFKKDSFSGIVDICITPIGFAYLEQTKYSNIDSQIGFCAMWFDDSMTAIWSEAISPAMVDAGYEPKRIDEHPHNNRIDDEIIALIRRSKFVVADFTGQRGGVYFEAGFALGMNLPVIWTVKKSELSSVHFDNRQYNFVTWEEDKLPELRLNLQYRIEATLGRGAWKLS